MKRWGFHGLAASHGVSISHRSSGSTGQHQASSQHQETLSSNPDCLFLLRILDEFSPEKKWLDIWATNKSLFKT